MSDICHSGIDCLLIYERNSDTTKKNKLNCCTTIWPGSSWIWGLLAGSSGSFACCATYEVSCHPSNAGGHITVKRYFSLSFRRLLKIAAWSVFFSAQLQSLPLLVGLERLIDLVFSITRYYTCWIGATSTWNSLRAISIGYEVSCLMSNCFKILILGWLMWKEKQWCWYIFSASSSMSTNLARTGDSRLVLDTSPVCIGSEILRDPKCADICSEESEFELPMPQKPDDDGTTRANKWGIVMLNQVRPYGQPISAQYRHHFRVWSANTQRITEPYIF